jgi:hypothetical protein
VSRFVGISVLFAVMMPSFLIFAKTTHSVPEKVPACCRRDGKHHCAMMTKAEDPSSETQVSSLAPACPFRNQQVTGSRTASYLPPAAMLIFAEVMHHPAIHTQTQAALRISEVRSHQKRGPPLSL